MIKQDSFLQYNHRETTSLSNLYVFVTVADAGSFSRAAKHLDMPVATTSRRIAQLEQQLQTVLFQRNTRNISLTKDGETFYEHIQPALSSLEEAFNLLSQQTQDIRGLIRLTAPVDFVKHCLSGIISTFMQEHPEIRLQLHLSPNHVDLVQERMDLAIRFGQLPDSGLYAQHVLDMPIQLFAAPSYLEHYPAIAQPEMLSSHNFIQLDTQKSRSTLEFFSAHRDQHKHSKYSSTRIKVQGNLQVNDMGGLIAFCEQGMGVALLPVLFVEQQVAQGRLQAVLPQLYTQSTPVHIVTTLRHPPTRVQALIESLKAHFKLHAV